MDCLFCSSAWIALMWNCVSLPSGFRTTLSRFWELLHSKPVHEGTRQLEPSYMQPARTCLWPDGEGVGWLQLDIQVLSSSSIIYDKPTVDETYCRLIIMYTAQLKNLQMGFPLKTGQSVFLTTITSVLELETIQPRFHWLDGAPPSSVSSWGKIETETHGCVSSSRICQYWKLMDRVELPFASQQSQGIYFK